MCLSDSMACALDELTILPRTSKPAKSKSKSPERSTTKNNKTVKVSYFPFITVAALFVFCQCNNILRATVHVFDETEIVFSATNPRLRRRLVPATDNVFGGLPISRRDFLEVRTTYSTKDEIKRPMEVVELPEDFTGQPPELTEVEQFPKYAAELFKDNINLPPKKSKVAVVSICIGMDLCDLTPRNHRYYTESHGYDYILLDKPVEAAHPKMLKYPLLSLVMDQGYEWVMMMDADALFTNVNKTIPSLLQSFSPRNTTSLIATRGGQWKDFHMINNGIFFLKTGEWAKQHCFDIYTAKWSYTRFLSKTLIDQPLQASILLANKDVEWPPKDEIEKGKNVMIVEKRAFNSFRRNDSRYNNTLSADNLEDSAWKRGDFIAHFPASNKLSLMIQLLEEEGMNELLPKVEERFPFSLPAPGKSNDAGHCWCDKDSLHCLPSYHIIGAQKAGSKILTTYLEDHPEVSSNYNKDPTHWLVDTATDSKIKKCAKLSKKKLPGILTKRGVDDPRRMSTCALEDYSLHHGKSVSEQGGTCKNGVLTQSPTKPLFDELFIWDYTFDHIRGVPLPELLHRLQPEARLLFPVRNPAEVVYSMYRASKDIQEENKSPEHLELFIRNATETWTSLGCTAANYRKCLPVELVKVGQWLSQGMYSQHLAQWLKHFPSSQVHIFDSSNVVDDEAKSLNKFMGFPAANGTTSNLQVSKDVDTEEGKSLSPQSSTMDTGSEQMSAAPTEASPAVFYEKMSPKTKRLLYEFYSPYQKEACHLLKKYRSVRVPFFKALCANSKPVNMTKTY